MRYYLFNAQDGQFESILPVSDELRVGQTLSEAEGRYMKVTWIGDPQIDKGQTPIDPETWWIFRPVLIEPRTVIVKG